MNKLTKRQLQAIKSEAFLTKKKWTDKKEHVLKLIRNFDKSVTLENLQHYLEVHVPSEEKRIHAEYFQKCQTGVIISNITPTDVADRTNQVFKKVDRPNIGNKYHLSWAFKGAVFVLKSVDQDGIHCYLDNPKHKRKDLLKAKIADLRHVK